MNGLLKNNFYGVAGNMKVLFTAIIIVGSIFEVIGDAAMVSIFAFIPAPIMALLAISCLRKESASKWGKYKITLPVKRKDIVKSQYVSHAIAGAIGVLVVAVFMGIAVIIHGNVYFYYGFRDAITLILSGGILAFFIGAIAYPLYYLWGDDKTEIIMVLAVLGAIAIVLGLSLLINIVAGEGGVSDTKYYLSLLIIVVIAAVAYLGSFALADSIFEKVEW